MRPRAIVAAALLVMIPPARADVVAPAGTPYQLSLGPDITAIVAGMLLWTTPTIVLHNQQHGPPCNPDPCNRDDVNPLERWAIDLHSETARYVGDGLFAALPPIWIGLELGDLGFHNAKAFFTDFAILAETMAWAGAIDEVFRHAVFRPRPFTYVAGLFPDLRVDAEASRSYYSGHTSALFAFSVTTAYTWSLRHPHSKWRAPVWIGLMALSTAEGVLRVASGDHFPSDVLAGAIMGSAVGLFVPMIHKRVAKSPVLSSLSLAPSQVDGRTTLWLSGRF